MHKKRPERTKSGGQLRRAGQITANLLQSVTDNTQ